MVGWGCANCWGICDVAVLYVAVLQCVAVRLHDVCAQDPADQEGRADHPSELDPHQLLHLQHHDRASLPFWASLVLSVKLSKIHGAK